MRSRPLSSLSTLALTIALAGCGGASGPGVPSAAGARPCAGYGSQTVGGYDVVVAVEAHAPILDAAQAASSGDPDTHVLVAGRGVDNSVSANHHVEVHVCDHATGAPVPHLTPSVTVQDLTAGSKPNAVPVAEVYPEGGAPSDVHYGNNVAFPSGHQAAVTVTLPGGSGTFKVAVE